jgi:ubiquinone/menaquinone biosynthesis C-methylase UbiE
MAEMNAVSRFFVNTLKARANARLYRWLRENLALPAGAACLEIGCGNGNMAARIVDGMAPARYVATDLDTRQIGAAREYLEAQYPQGVPPRLELQAADMLALPFPDASFDAIFAFAAIHHASPSHRDFTNVPKALAEIDRVLRPGGALAYQEFVHKERIRAWLGERGYRVQAFARGWTRETVVAVKRA